METAKEFEPFDLYLFEPKVAHFLGDEENEESLHKLEFENTIIVNK